MTCECGRGCVNLGLCRSREHARRLREARAEDLRWMAETGETFDRAAARLGLTSKVLERWMFRYAPDLFPKLPR